jgi:cellulose synthase/poly-beta-1,6-N-acetylglucosamine synthase-like glycosyltransferase
MRLSIVVCAYNEEGSIGPLLENLICQRVPPEVVKREVVVVASGCTDATVEVVRRYMGGAVTVKLVEQEARLGKASALNQAFAVCEGDYVVLVPADVCPAAGALFNLLVPFRDRGVSAVSGRPVQDPRVLSDGFIGYLAGMTYRLWGRLMRRLGERGEAGHCSGELMAVRKDVVTTIPDGCAADDSYIAIVAMRKGVIAFASGAVGHNLMPRNIVDYVNQRRRWLFGHFQTKKVTGEFPTVMDTLIFSRPRVVLRVLVEEVAERPERAVFLAAAVIVEALIYVLAVFDHAFGREYGVWPVIRSTKYAEVEVVLKDTNAS